MKLTKTTVLEGHYATGDWECFCFDTHSCPEEHMSMLVRARDNDEEVNPDDYCRVYPNDLIPEGTEHRKGRWTITIEFEPEEP